MPLNSDKGPAITKEWLDELLVEKLPYALDSIGKAKPFPVAEFAKLVQMDRRLNPAPPRVREVRWLDFVDSETLRRFDEERR
jgi:hypothetical protein